MMIIIIMIKIIIIIIRVSRRCHHRIASSGHRVAPPWPCLQRLAGTDPVSLRSWSVQRVRGRPGRRPQSLPSERLDARLTWQCGALCAGVPWVSRAMWPNTDKRRLLMKTTTCDKLVRTDISAFVTRWDRCMCKIWRWHFMWNASNVFLSYESSVQAAVMSSLSRIWVSGSN